uniref:Uncharacterized protein n=1 Tax=Acrobeloides nanus TaxID=290746 RepID=A0A914C1F4_9BILA
MDKQENKNLVDLSMVKKETSLVSIVKEEENKNLIDLSMVKKETSLVSIVKEEVNDSLENYKSVITHIKSEHVKQEPDSTFDQDEDIFSLEDTTTQKFSAYDGYMINQKIYKVKDEVDEEHEIDEVSSVHDDYIPMDYSSDESIPLYPQPSTSHDAIHDPNVTSTTQLHPSPQKKKKITTEKYRRASNKGGRSKFSDEHAEKYPHIQRSIKGQYFFYCSICQKHLAMSTRGPIAIEIHIKTEWHMELAGIPPSVQSFIKENAVKYSRLNAYAYKDEYTEMFPGIQPSSKGPEYFFCTLCDAHRTLGVSLAAKIKRHMQSKNHLLAESGKQPNFNKIHRNYSRRLKPKMLHKKDPTTEELIELYNIFNCEIVVENMEE